MVGITWMAGARCTVGGLMRSHEFAAGILGGLKWVVWEVWRCCQCEPTNVQHTSINDPPNLL
jgi:hypothetical protein